jgi:drug/metabolite transporter (DMT)-like permease
MVQVILLIILGIDWASGYAIAGYCMTHGVNPYGYSFWQSFGPMVVLLVIHFIMKQKIIFNKLTLKYITLSGVTGIVIPNLLIYISASHVPSGLLTILSNISPLFLYILALLFKEEKFSLIRCAAILIGFIGVIFIIADGQQLFKLQLGGAWLFIVLLIPVGYAFSAVYVSKFRPETGNSLNYALGMLVVSAIFNAPLVYFNQGFYALHSNDTNTWLIILEALLSTLGYVLLFVIIKMVGAVYYTLVNTITALTGVIYGYFIFNQKYSNNIYLAIAFVILALVILTATQKKALRHGSGGFNSCTCIK